MSYSPLTGVLITRENLDIETGRMHVTMEAQIGVKHLQGREGQALQATTRSYERGLELTPSVPSEGISPANITVSLERVIQELILLIMEYHKQEIEHLWLVY